MKKKKVNFRQCLYKFSNKDLSRLESRVFRQIFLSANDEENLIPLVFF